MRPESIYRPIYLWLSNQPKWLQIGVPLVVLVLSFIVLQWFGLIVMAAVLVFTFVYGRKDPDVSRRFTIKYITGLSKFSKPMSNMALYIDEDGLRFKYPLRGEVKVAYDTISKMEAETKTQITRTASMLKGAVGLALAGPLGAMIGMGIGSKHDDSQYFVTVVYKDELGEDNLIVLQQSGMMSANAYEVVSAMKEARKRYILSHKN